MSPAWELSLLVASAVLNVLIFPAIWQVIRLVWGTTLATRLMKAELVQLMKELKPEGGLTMREEVSEIKQELQHLRAHGSDRLVEVLTEHGVFRGKRER